MTVYENPVALYRGLKDAWSTESSPHWTAENPSKGQCRLSSLVFHELFGGDILATDTPDGLHYYNRLDGKVWDLTISQFEEPIAFENREMDADQVLAEAVPERLAALRSRLGLA